MCCALGTGWNERKFHAFTQHLEQHLDWLDEAQVYTILEICGALDSQSKAKQDFIDTSRKRASIQQKRTSGHGFQAVKQAPGAGYKVNDVIEITVSVSFLYLTLTDQIYLRDNEKHCGNNLVSHNNLVQYRRENSRDRKTSYTFYLLMIIYFN